MTDTTRDAFEAWADNARPHQRLRSSTTDNYDYPLRTILFECWQAATLAEQGKRQPLTEGMLAKLFEAFAHKPEATGFSSFNWFVAGATIAEAAHEITATPPLSPKILKRPMQYCTSGKEQPRNLSLTMQLIYTCNTLYSLPGGLGKQPP